MKLSIVFFLALVIGLASCSSQKKQSKTLLYVGTYSDNNSQGIYCFDFHEKTGELTPVGVTPNQENPSFLAISPNGKNFYAVSEVKQSTNIDSGSVTAYRVEPDGVLKKINQVATEGYHPAHVSVSPDGKYVVAANYTSGSLSIFTVRDDGGLDKMIQLIQHEGGGADTARQKGPHAHSSQFTKDGKLLIAADLGTNKVYFYQLAGDGLKFIPATQATIDMEPGSGPRHFDFSPDGQFIYVMNEMKATVSVLKKEGDRYELIQTVSALPDGYEGFHSGADIHVSSDGRFVYSSNRGHNSIAVFRRDVDGEIALLENVPVEGNWPRNLVLSPDGGYMLVANRRSNNITIFKIDQKTGDPIYTGQSVEVPNPVCLKFLPPGN